jgi:hypothetical protein
VSVGPFQRRRGTGTGTDPQRQRPQQASPCTAGGELEHSVPNVVSALCLPRARCFLPSARTSHLAVRAVRCGAVASERRPCPCPACRLLLCRETAKTHTTERGPQAREGRRARQPHSALLWTAGLGCGSGCPPLTHTSGLCRAQTASFFPVCSGSEGIPSDMFC